MIMHYTEPEPYRGMRLNGKQVYDVRVTWDDNDDPVFATDIGLEPGDMSFVDTQESLNWDVASRIYNILVNQWQFTDFTDELVLSTFFPVKPWVTRPKFPPGLGCLSL
eukprot:SAG31_NODE_9733_length_1235_cov_1.808099_2_plen_108_part_00